MLRTFIRATFAAAALVLSIGTASAATVYNLPPGQPGTNFFVQQTGNNVYYYGDDVTLSGGGSQLLNSVTLTYVLYSTTANDTYTPSLTLDIFAIDPVTRLPVGGPIGTATENTATFQGSDGSTNRQAVTFDFTGQGVILPTDFAFAYHDNLADGVTNEAQGFSVLGSLSSLPTVGSTVDGFLDASPNDPNHTFHFGPAGFGTDTGNLWATVDATSVPEPAAVIMLGTGVLSLIGYRRRMRKQAA
jgi:hypothetical protein